MLPMGDDQVYAEVWFQTHIFFNYKKDLPVSYFVALEINAVVFLNWLYNMLEDQKVVIFYRVLYYFYHQFLCSY